MSRLWTFPQLVNDVHLENCEVKDFSESITNKALEQAGVKNVFVEFPKIAHEWQTWRKALNDFAPRIFK